MAQESDEVDRIVEAWIAQRPDLDFSPLEVLSRVDRLSRHLDRARRDAFRRSELEPWEWDVLSALRRAGDPFQLSPKQLLQQTLVSSGTMTNRIDRLVDAGSFGASPTRTTAAASWSRSPTRDAREWMPRSRASWTPRRSCWAHCPAATGTASRGSCAS